MIFYERLVRNKGFCLIVGVDEVGWGLLVGFVVVSVVIFLEECEIFGLIDFKKFLEKKCDEYYEFIMKEVLVVGIGIVEVFVIDEVNIYEVLKMVMVKVIYDLLDIFDYLFVDVMMLLVGID